MTIEERVEKLRNLITCMKCEVSGKVCDLNCPTQYDAGNMGEIIENLDEIVKLLDPRNKQYLTINNVIKRFNTNAAYERANGNLQGYLEFRQIARWLRKYQRIIQVYQTFTEVNFSYDKAMRKIINIIESEDGDD